MGDLGGMLQSMANPAPAPADGPMSDDELEASVRMQFNDAATFVDTEISPRMEKALNYYQAKPYGDEQPGRSQVISQDVKDTVLAILPSLLNIFFSSERVVEYVPRTPEKAKEAEQATDYVNYVLTEENQGFLAFQGWFKDALRLKVAVIKVYAEDQTDVRSETYTGMDEMQRALLHMDPDVRVDAERSYQIERAEPAPPAGQPQPGQPPPAAQPPPLEPGMQPGIAYDLNVSRTIKAGKRFRVVGIPSEEFLISRNATSVENASFCAHRTSLTASDLMSMGYSKDIVDEYGASDSLSMNVLRIARQPWMIQQPAGLGSNPDPAMRLIQYAECFVRTDYDGDGFTELRRVCLMGAGLSMVYNKVCDEAPFAALCPDPEPHVFYGGSIADQTMDIQRIKSQILRLLLDSLAQTIRPRSWIVEGAVNQDDALNSEVGAVVRMRAPGMMGDLSTPFVGQSAFPVLDYMDGVRENRTGITKASQGLDPDALQSSTKVAVAATLEAAQQHIGMIARIFAETGVSRLFRILLRLITTHQDKARMVRLRNEWVEVNPSEWDKGMDVAVNTALGTGQKQDQLQALAMVAQKQEQILQTLGPANPLVSAAQYSNTLRRMCELAGFRDSSQFFSVVPPDWQPPPPPNQTPDPRNDPRAQAALILAQAQQQQTQADIIKKHGELQLEREKMFLEDATQRYKIEADYNARLFQTQAQFHADSASTAAKIQTQNQQISSDERMAAAGNTSGEAQAMDQQDAGHIKTAMDQAHEQQMAQAQQAHEQSLADRQAQQQTAPGDSGSGLTPGKIVSIRGRKHVIHTVHPDQSFDAVPVPDEAQGQADGQVDDSGGQEQG